MSELKVNKISPASGTETTLGDSSDDFLLPSGAEIIAQSGSTITIASGATLANAGTATGFGGGAWDYVSTATASTSASLAFTNMVDGSDYLYTTDAIFPVDNDTDLRAEFGVAGPTYRTSGYIGQVQGITTSGTSQSGELTTGVFMNNDATNVGLGNVAPEGNRSGYLLVTNPANASTKTSCHGMATLLNPSTQILLNFYGSIYNTTAEAHTSIKFILSSGNIVSGKILQYKRARS